MGELAKVGGAEIVPVESGLTAVIERALSDPATDVNKLERLLAMQERVMERNAKSAFTVAKVAMRPELPEITMKGHIVIKKDGKVTQDTPFARFEDIHEAIMPVLTLHGFDLSFKNGLAEDGKVRVTTILTHIEGHSEETYFDLPHDSSGSKNAVQAVGSSTSYAKRYGVLSILNIKVVGEDDNANSSESHTVHEKAKDAPFPQGPAKNKTELKALGRDLWRDVDGCEDSDQLEALLGSQKPLLDQLAIAMPSWLQGGRDGQGDTYEGLNAVIARKRRDFQFIA